eukprot:2831121-Pyramimonas_sp.AAC.1
MGHCAEKLLTLRVSPPAHPDTMPMRAGGLLGRQGGILGASRILLTPLGGLFGALRRHLGRFSGPP